MAPQPVAREEARRSLTGDLAGDVGLADAHIAGLRGFNSEFHSLISLARNRNRYPIEALKRCGLLG